MKNFKRILALVLTFTFVLSMAIVGVSASYQGKWYAAAVDYLDSISISDIGAFGDEPLSRDEFVTWVAKIESHQTIESAWKDIEFVALNTFSDVDSSNHKGAISYSVGREFIVGNGDGTFTPHNTVTFAEACAVIVRLMDYADLVQGSTWDEQVHWYQHIANAYCGAIDDVFLRESETYDPEYKLSKGEGAYLLYSIMNGAYWTGANKDASINRTSYGVDLGEYFGTAPFAKVSAQYVVVSAPLKYSSPTQVFRRYDAYITGATYDALYDDSHLYQSTGALDTASDKPVVLVNTFTGEYLNVDPSVFSKLALAADAEAADALEVVEVGGVVTLTFIRRVFDAATAQNYLDTTEYVTLTVNEALAADTYVGRDKAKPDNSIEGWRKAATDVASNSNNAARLTDAKVYWNGDTLVVNGDEYTIVDEYTGAAYELKVFAPAEVASTTTKSLISVVGYTGDKVYAGATFSDGQKAILLAHGDYASKFNGNTVKETFTLTSDIPSFVAYELKVEGAFVTATSFGVVSNIIGSDGRIDDNVIDTTTALTVEEAKSLILEPAQGESNVVFSDTDRDGIYDIAVVTESSRALYYTGVNNSSYDLGNEFIGGNDTNWEKSANRTREIYDAFGNYILSVATLKGNGIGGLVVDQTVSLGGATFAGGTDNWKLVDTATDKVQLVVTVSNERQSYGGNNDTQLYGVSAAHPYKVVDVADLTTGYVFTGSNETVTIDGTAYYRYIIQNADDTFSIVYIPATPADQVDVDVTLDGVTSTVTFNAGKDLLAASVAAPGSKLVGHTVKYVADENGVVWCIKDVAKKSAVTGFVTGSGTTKTAGVYNVTLVTTGHSGKSEIEYTGSTTAALVAERIGYGYTSALFTNSFGIDALFAKEGEKTVKVWRFTEAGEMYLLAKGATQATTTYNFASEAEAAAFVEKYGLYRAGKYVITAADGSYVAAPASMFEAAENFVTTGGYDYYVVDAAEVEAERVFDGNAVYYTQNADDGFNRAEGLQEFDPDTTYYTIVVTPVDQAGAPVPDPDTTYYTGDDMAWAVADVTDGFDPQTEYYTIVATEVEAELVFDAQETYYTTDGTDYFFADIQEFEDGVTYYTLEANVANGDFDAEEDYYVAIDDDFYKVAADQFTEAGDSYYVADGDDYVQNDLPIALESTDYFVADTAGTLTVTRNNFNGLFCHGVSGNAPLTGLYYAAVDGETMPMIKATGYVNGAFGSLFVAGTLFSYSDGRYYVKDEFRDYYDVTSYVTENNFDALTEIATLYVLVDGDYVVAEEYDAEAVYYALFFEEVEYDAYDLFGYIDWTKFGDTVEVEDTSIKALEAAAVDYYTGTGVNTYEVKASLTSVWGSSASATDLLTAILDGKLYNAANLAEDDTFTSNDLLYVSLTLDGSGYYALEGVDTASYDRTVVSTGFNHTASGAWTMVNIGNDTTNTFLQNLKYNGTSSNYRTRIRLAYSFDIVAAGAATTWVAGGDEWDNSYILKYEKVEGTQELLDANAAGQVPGEKNEYKMTIGYNPYFVKSVDSNGKVTFKLQWTELAEYKGIIGTTTYKFDPNKAVLIPLYVDSGKTQLVNGSVPKDYTKDNDYFVDEEGLVWKIDSAEVAYDHDLSKGTTIYDDTNKVATGATATAPTSYNTLKTVEVTKSGDTYKLNINMGLGSTPKVVTIDADKEIVIVTPTDTKVVTITVTTAAKLYEAGQTIFATEYQLNGTTLSVIGTTSGNASEINIPTVSETPTEDPDNPDDPTAEVKTCYITPEGLALDITTGEVFTAVKNAPAAGYYNVSKSGAVKGEAELLDGVVTAISPLGKATGIDGDVVFIQDGTVSDKQPWGVAYSYLYVELYVSSILSQQVPEVTFSYIVVNGVNYVLVDTIAHN